MTAHIGWIDPQDDWIEKDWYDVGVREATRKWNEATVQFNAKGERDDKQS